jgi:hypothetical protein
MFQVDPDKVMYATGEPKLPKFVLKLHEERSAWSKEDEDASETAASSPVDVEGVSSEAADAAAGENAVVSENPEGPESPARDPIALQRKRLTRLVKSAKHFLTTEKSMLNVHRKRQLREFTKAAKLAMSQTAKSPEPQDPQSVMDALATLLKDFKLDGDAVVSTTSPPEPSKPETEAVKAATELSEAGQETAKRLTEENTLTQAEQTQLVQLLKEDEENPYDPSKPYVTPWQPRQYLAPFAFIPRYLEVNQNICSAVYLRHPVARRGLAEVPTPFPYDVSQLAFTWYLRRR